jgi:MBOAT, membrane-bound O-acyltransferase family
MASFVRQYVISLNYYDGGVDPSKLTSREQQYALKQVPSFVDYFGYNFFSSTVMVGPFIEFKTFTDWINLRGQFKDIPAFGQIPTLMRRFAVACICILTAAKLGQFISFDYMESTEFASGSLPFKMLYLIGGIQLFWEQYFSGFVLMDCALISSGIAYAPKTDKTEETFFAI